jgi:transcriptional regulator with XRE-family HTH domain
MRLTRDELAKRTGLDPRQIASYELYSVWPKPEQLELLREAFDVDIHDLFDFTDRRIRSMFPLDERLAKRGVVRSDKGRSRKPHQK